MKKLLINENRDRAESDILNLAQHGKAVADVIKLWNSQRALKPITTTLDLKEFLQDPFEMLDRRILSDSGVTFGEHKPDPKIVAQMFRIQYDDLVRGISTSRARNLKFELFSFNEGTGEIVLTEQGKEQISEWSKVYLTNPAEIEEFNKLQTVAESLNELFVRFGSNGLDINAAGHALPFLKAVPGSKPGERWKLMPNEAFVKKLAKTA
jgi:hypothetical protein